MFDGEDEEELLNKQQVNSLREHTKEESADEFVYGSLICDEQYFDTPMENEKKEIDLSDLLMGLDSKMSKEDGLEEFQQIDDESTSNDRVHAISKTELSSQESFVVNIPENDTNGAKAEREEVEETIAIEKDFSFVIWMMVVLEGEYPSEVLERLVESETVKNLSKSQLLQLGVELMSKMQDD